ncbi:uncharacterized protein LOC134180028 [Corticium candelabrum]|uniref:uncharacterized protein LOC134180028 n=1 Tax=Corticium candelabrum TaxID=121492 RepID=UPI002E2677DC|nr:uncharacterized protein LOC134180028 [Corticium candelabrum]
MDDGQRYDPVFSKFLAKAALGVNDHEGDHESADLECVVTCEEVIHKQGWLLHGCMSKEECQRLIAVCEEVGFQQAKDYCFQYRDRFNDRMMSDDEQLADFLWRRVQAYVPQYETDSNGHQWRVKGLNRRFRICRYFSGHYFGAHIDGEFYASDREKSFYTCMLYLNDKGHDFQGGATRFLDINARKKAKFDVEPKAGLCIVFYQKSRDTYHEGLQLTEGTKYILRTDVMYTMEL